MTKCTHSTGWCTLCRKSLFNPTYEDAIKYTTDTLTEKILQAKHEYYCLGRPKLRDEEYDAIESSLRTINPDAPVLEYVGCPRCGGKYT